MRAGRLPRLRRPIESQRSLRTILIGGSNPLLPHTTRNVMRLLLPTRSTSMLIIDTCYGWNDYFNDTNKHSFISSDLCEQAQTTRGG